jgi:GntR family transcriptional regulator
MGFFVAEKRQIYSKAERLRRLRLAVDDFIHEAVFLDFSAEEIRKVVDEKLTELDWETRPIGGKHDRNSSL